MDTNLDQIDKILITKVIKIDHRENVIIWLLYHLTLPASKLLARRKVSPNFITTLGLVFVGISGYFLILGTHRLACAAFWYLAISFDLIDGQVARITNKVRRHSFGYDHTSDLLKLSFTFLCGGIYFSSLLLWPIIAVCLTTLFLSDVLNNEISFARSSISSKQASRNESTHSTLATNIYTIFLTYNIHTLLVFPIFMVRIQFAIFGLTYLILLSIVNCLRFIIVLRRIPRRF